jgi:hypothetical protein
MIKDPGDVIEPAERPEGACLLSMGAMAVQHQNRLGMVPRPGDSAQYERTTVGWRAIHEQFIRVACFCTSDFCDDDSQGIISSTSRQR